VFRVITLPTSRTADSYYFPDVLFGMEGNSSMRTRSVLTNISLAALTVLAILALSDSSVFARFHIRSVPSSVNGFADPPFTCPDGNATPFAVALDNSVPIPAACDLSATLWFKLPSGPGFYPNRAFSLTGSMPSNPNSTFTIAVIPALWTSSTSDTSSQTIFLLQFSATDPNLALNSFVAGRLLPAAALVGCNDSVPLHASSNSSTPGFCTPMPPTVPSLPAYADENAKALPIEPAGITASDLTTTRWDLSNFKSGTTGAPAVIALSAFGFPSEFIASGVGATNDNGLVVADFDPQHPNFLAVVANTSTGEVATSNGLTLKPAPATAPPAPSHDVQSNAKAISSPVFADIVSVTNSLPQPDAQLDLPVTNSQDDPTLPVVNPCDFTQTQTLSVPLFRTVWYSYTPTSTGVIHLDTSGSRYDTYVAVYPTPPASIIGSDDDQSAPADDPLVQAKVDITPTTDMVGKPLLIEIGETPTLVCDFTNAVNGAPLLLPPSTDATLKFSLVQDGTPATAFSASTLSFTPQLIGTTSASQKITVTNSGTANLTVSGVTAPTGFSQTEDCSSAPVAPGATCTVTVSFAPTASGSVTGNITFTDNAAGFPNTVSVSGEGTSFSLSAGASSTGTLTSSGPATYTLTASGTSGFTDSITFACSKLPSNTTCSFTPATATPGTGSTQVTLTVSRISTSALRTTTKLFSASLGFAVLALLWGRLRTKSSRLPMLVVLSLVLFATFFNYACGGSSPPPPPPPPPSVQPTAGSYTFQVTPIVGGQPIGGSAITLTLTVQ
jgi:hypothetical protein